MGCGEEVPCPDYNTNQLECSMTMEIKNPLQEPLISKCFIGGPRELEQYVQEMLDGILDFEVNKGNWKYTYHDRMTNYYVDNSDTFPNTHSADQVQFIIDELKAFRCFSQMKITNLELFQNALKIMLVSTGNVLSPHKYFQFIYWKSISCKYCNVFNFKKIYVNYELFV